jgi:threonine dehydrogenase-like Zn-dependent dehydrogenase
MVKFAKVFGAHPLIVVARRDAQLAYAVEIGANYPVNAATQDAVKAVKDLTGGRGADVLIDTTGDIEFVSSMVPAVAAEGKIATYATYKRDVAVDKVLDPKRLVRGVGSGEDTCHPYMMDAVRLGIIKPSEFYSHRLPLSMIKEGFDLIKKKIAFKVVFEMEE